MDELKDRPEAMGDIFDAYLEHEKKRLTKL
jgi:hypothetical protein